MTDDAASPKAAPDNPGCLARALASALRADPKLEAVTINSAQEKLSIATLGKPDEAALAGQVRRTVEQARTVFPCGLLEGTENCENCAAPLSNEEHKNVIVQREGDRTTVARVTCPTAPRFWRWRELPLPRFIQREVELPEHDHPPGEWKWQLLCAALCLVFGLMAWAVTPRGAAPHSLSYVFFGLAYLAGSWFAAEELWEHLRERGGLDVHFLMLFVAAGAASIGAWAEGATLLFLFSFAGSLEHYAMERTRREIRSLFRDTPKTAVLVDGQGREQELAVEAIQPGMKLLVKPGGQFPVDAEISRGKTAADESNLTGEAAPVEKAVGDTVLAGTINLWGAVETVALRPAAASSLQKIIRLIKDAQQHKAPAQTFTDRFSATYTYLIITMSFVMFFVWWLGMGLAPFKSAVPGHPGMSAFYRTMTLLVVASPCALVLSIPSAVLAAIAWGARHGILIRGGAAVEKLAEVDVVAMDKTGTLTTGDLAVEKVESFPPGREVEIARLAYSLEKLSTHPLARAITRYGKQQQLESAAFDHFESVTGEGLRATRNGRLCRLGGRDWFNTGRHGNAIAQVPAVDAGFSEVWIEEEELLGRVILRDDIRPQARQVVEELRREGLRTVVLTGDRQAAADHLQTALQLDETRAELKPEGKVAAIRALSSGNHRVAMVGDGVNDAPSLAAAHVGVAMGARGSDAALEQADVILMHDRLENFLAAFRLSQRARRIIRQNLVISLGTVVVLVSFAALGKIPLPLGVVGHEGSTVVVVMNSLRLLLGKDRQV